MDGTIDKKTAWWSVPFVWLIVGLPLLAVIGGTLTVWIAYHFSDTPVMSDVAKVGKGIVEVVDRERRAAELGVAAGLSAEPGRLTLKLEGRFVNPPDHLTLTLGHATDSRLDMVVQMIAQGDGVYAANYAEIPAGKRTLELMPADRTWRVTGNWQAPFTGSTRLAAPAQVSPPLQSATQP